MTFQDTFHKAFILCVIILICSVAVEAEVEKEAKIEESFPAEGISILVAKIGVGEVRVSAWERPEVAVEILKKVSADNNEKANKFLNEIEVQIEKKSSKIEIETEQPVFTAILGKVNISVEYHIFMPEDIALDITAKDGLIYIDGVRSKEKLSTLKGNIELRNVAGSISAKTYSGNIYAEVLFDAESNFSTMDGLIDLRIGDDFSVPISARTLSGSINVAIPEGYSAEVDATTTSGIIKCNFPIDGSVEDKLIKGKLFGGGPPLKLNTAGGDIAIVSIMDMPIETYQADISSMEEIPVAEVVKTSVPPTIDGRLDDKCWIDAVRLGDFVSADGMDAASEPTVAYITWDEQNLYIGVKCYESRITEMTISNTEDDNAAWDDDMVQILIDPVLDDEAEEYFHISVNPIGAVYDQKVDSNFVARRWEEWHGSGAKWNSDGLINTDIRDMFWNIEAAIPFSSMEMEPSESDILGFNIYRSEQYRSEHTYWSPTYGQHDWPHVPSRFGELVLISSQPTEEPSPEPSTTSETALTISGITIDGNEKVTQEEIMGALKLKQGDIPDVDALSRAKIRLEALGWFREVDIELSESEKGVDLIVNLTEKNIVSPSEVKIRGAELFTKKRLMKYFNLTTGKITMQDAKTKCRLIQKLYRSKGYAMATAECSFVIDTLIVDINEGHIDRIVVTGNTKIDTDDVIDALDVKVGMIYKQDEMDNAIRVMRDQIPHFRRVDWDVGRTDDGLNVVYIDVEEEKGFTVKVDGTGEFNRVHGLQWGLASEEESRYIGLKGHWKVLYGFSSKIWNYQFGIEKTFFNKHKMTVGVDVHKITDTNDNELVSDVEHFIAEAILGESWRDFYQRKGYELSYGQKLTRDTNFGLKYRDDKYTSLEKTNDWSLLDRSYSDEDWSDEFRWTGGRKVYTRADNRIDEDEDRKYKAENPPIEEGKIKSLIAEYTIDTRNSKYDPTNGWLNTFSAEYAGHQLGGDSDFRLYKANIRRYNRLGGNQFFTFRIKAATTDTALPELHPRKFHLGGIGTLRGYRFKEFQGDKMLLFNAEYWVLTNWPLGLGLVFFLDSGYAWPYEINMDIDDLKTDVGVGFQLGGLRINFASPIGEEDVETILSARLARMF